MASTLAAATVAVTPAAACGQWFEKQSSPALVTVRVMADTAPVGPGQAFQVAVVFDVEPGWHIYWKNPGEGAMPPEIDVRAPDGFEVGATRWPRPKAFKTPIGLEYCYTDRAVLFIPVKAPPRLDDGRAAFEVSTRWAVCKHVCKVGSIRLPLEIETSAQPRTPRGEPDPILTEHARRLPAPLDEAPGGGVTLAGNLLTLTGPAGGSRSAVFFPVDAPGVSWGEARVAIDGGRFLIAVGVEVNPANALDGPIVLEGLVGLGEALDDPCYDFAVPLSELEHER